MVLLVNLCEYHQNRTYFLEALGFLDISLNCMFNLEVTFDLNISYVIKLLFGHWTTCQNLVKIKIAIWEIEHGCQKKKKEEEEEEEERNSTDTEP